MQLHHIAIAAVAGAIALQAAPCQDHVSLAVTSTIGKVGSMCEPFQCLPNQTLGNLGETLKVEVYAAVGNAYVLFTGSPAVGCQPIGGILGELAAWAPILTYQVGFISDGYVGGPCDVGLAVTKYRIPEYLPLGTQFRLQALGFTMKEGPAFSRATEVHTR